MKKELQAAFLAIVPLDNSSRYKVDFTVGKVLTFKKGKDAFVELQGGVMPNGYRQVVMYDGKDNGLRLYVHQAVWLYCNGIIPDGFTVRHRDGDKENNSIGNLFIEDISYVKGSSTESGKHTDQAMIMKIREMTAFFPRRSYASIARELGVNKSTFCRIALKIQRGQKLKNEDPKPHPSPKNKITKSLKIVQ